MCRRVLADRLVDLAATAGPTLHPATLSRRERLLDGQGPILGVALRGSRARRVQCAALSFLCFFFMLSWSLRRLLSIACSGDMARFLLALSGCAGSRVPQKKTDFDTMVFWMFFFFSVLGAL